MHEQSPARWRPSWSKGRRLKSSCCLFEPSGPLEARVRYDLPSGKAYLRKQISVRLKSAPSRRLLRADLDNWRGVKRAWDSMHGDRLPYGSHPIFCSYEAGHRPKLLVVVDDTVECDRARMDFASRRAARIGGGVVMLRVIETHDQGQQWLGVADIMRAEAHEEAEGEVGKYAVRAKGIAGIAPSGPARGREGRRSAQLIDEDEDISVLVVAAGAGSEGPGWSSASARCRRCRIPVSIDRDLSDKDIEAPGGLTRGRS